MGTTSCRFWNIPSQLHRWYPSFMGTTSLTSPRRTPNTSAPSSCKNTVEGRVIRLCSRLTTSMFLIRHHPGVNLNHIRTLVTSLVYRFQKASRIHNVDGFQGHILRQPGPLSDWPGMGRTINVSARDGWGKYWSYRLIDLQTASRFAILWMGGKLNGVWRRCRRRGRSYRDGFWVKRSKGE